jgi:predicted XRE-type DNA-binding protein
MNWKKLIKEIMDSGMTQASVADYIGIKQPSVNEIINSETRKGVRWETGNKILALHKRRLKK